MGLFEGLLLHCFERTGCFELALEVVLAVDVLVLWVTFYQRIIMVLTLFVEERFATAFRSAKRAIGVHPRSIAFVIT